jgi:cell division protein FtsB
VPCVRALFDDAGGAGLCVSVVTCTNIHWQECLYTCLWPCRRRGCTLAFICADDFFYFFAILWCGLLCTGTWVCAIRLYCEVFRTVAPKKAALKKAMSSLRVKQEALAKSKAELQEVSEKVAALQAKFDTSVGEKNRLRDEAEKLEAYLLRAQQLVEGLAGERVRVVLCVGRVWDVCCGRESGAKNLALLLWDVSKVTAMEIKRGWLPLVLRSMRDLFEVGCA